MKKANSNSPGRKYKKIHNPSSLSWTNVLTVGIILFVLSILVLALKVHYDGSHYYSETSQNHRHFLSRQSSRAIADTPRIPTKYELQRQLKKRSAYVANNHTTTDDILGSLWVVLSESGLIVRENMEYNSEILGTLTKGAILLGKELIENRSGSFSERLKITFPMVGWISTGAHRRDPFILNINIDKDKRCLEEVFQSYVDYVGGDIFPEPVSASSPMECCIHCTLAAGCSSWSHTSENACWLKNTFSRAKPTTKEITSGQFPSRGMISRRTLNNHMMYPRETDSCCSSDMLANVSGISSIGVLSLQLGTGLPLGTIGDDRLDDDLSSSSYVLRQSRSSIDWTQQWPIGTGRFGAMVGGSFDEEIVPLSITNLYVGKPQQLVRKPQPSGAKIQSNVHDHGNSRMAAFKEARLMLSKGEIVKAKKLMRILQDDNVLSMFQYACDLSLLYSITPIVARNAKTNNPPRPVPSARAAVIETMRRSLEDILPVRKLGSLHLSHGLLDLRNGITHSSFIYELPDVPLNAMKTENQGHNKGTLSKATSNSTSTPTPTTTYTQYREWFASSMDDVIVGSVSCAKTSISATTVITEGEESSGCLNMALQLSRQMNPGHGAPILTNVQISSWPPPDWSPHEKQQEKDRSQSVSDSTYAISLSFGNEKNNIPFVQVCGAVICDGGGSGSGGDILKGGSKATDSNPDSMKPLLICNNANSLDLILSLSLSTTKSTSTTSPAESCWSTVSSALNLGVTSLRSRHILDFSMKMERVDVSFQSFNESSSCPGETLQSRLRSFGSSCQANGDIQMNGQDSLLVTQSFHYGRYLMLSTGTHAVANLQGLWADGPTSAWSGDYHLNINLQMAYWAMDVTDMSREVFPPLLAFIKSMAKHGQITAQDLYGCDGWVAHGFTDANFNMGILGDAQWALCVSCGAWLALHLWDHLTYQYDLNYLVEDVLPVFRGADGFQHTGPTTSPENSYQFVDTTNLRNQHQGEVPPPILSHFSSDSSSTNNRNRNSRMALMKNIRGGGGGRVRKGGVEESQLEREQLTPEQLHNLQVRNAIQNDLNQDKLGGGPGPGQGQNQQEAMAAAVFPETQEVIEFLAFSPAIDISVLRQVSNAYHICIEWMRLALLEKEEGEDALPENKINYNSSQLLKDTKLAEKFSGMVFGMPGGAAPMVDKVSGLIVEYPGVVTPSMSTLNTADANAEAVQPPSTERVIQKPHTANYAMTNEFDMGHRHFSSLHWLYPGTFHPSKSSHSDSSSLLDSPYMQAALVTMKRKALESSGHTSWSAAWQACLWARLRQSEDLWTSLSRLLRKYSSANLLSLHPLLDKVGSEQCSTCFIDPTFSMDTLGSDSIPSPERGLQTQDGAKFQIDGNLGTVAAISEMLLQSHVAGQISLLPALPVPLMEKGFLRGLRVRGGGVVSVSWLYGRVSVASLRFDSYHPWLMGMKEGQPGFYRSNIATSHVGAVGRNFNIQLEVLSPNLILPLGDSSQARPSCVTSSEQNLRSSKRTSEKGITRIILMISQFPCTIVLCASEISPSFCTTELAKLNRYSHLAYEPKE